MEFLIFHLLLYPAIHSYNSYYDKDKNSIGGLKNPPPVSRNLLYVSFGFDVVALVLGFIIGWQFVLAIFIYSLLTKAYSYDKIRLKKYPLISLLGVGLIQGSALFFMIFLTVPLTPVNNPLRPVVLIPGLLQCCYLLGSYPMTQIYQHKEDGERGDKTMSMVLGIRGTFIFAGILFVLTLAGFFCYFTIYNRFFYGVLYVITQIPVILYFIYWFLLCRKETAKADYKHAMLLNFLSSTTMICFCLTIFVLKRL